MKMRKLIATKSHKYGTRQLTAGDEYDLPVRQAIALVAAKKARFADTAKATATRRTIAQPAVKPEPEPALAAATEAPAAVEAPNLDALRLRATQLGINVDGRWGIYRLQQEIDEATRG